MKTCLIIFLASALTVVAFATRPGKRELMLYMLDQRSPSGDWSRKDLHQAEELAKEATINDRLLWVDVEKDGKVIYTGAFAHFFPRGTVADKEKPLPTAVEFSRLMQAFSVQR